MQLKEDVDGQLCIHETWKTETIIQIKSRIDAVELVFSDDCIEEERVLTVVGVTNGKYEMANDGGGLGVVFLDVLIDSLLRNTLLSFGCFQW